MKQISFLMVIKAEYARDVLKERERAVGCTGSARCCCSAVSADEFLGRQGSKPILVSVPVRNSNHFLLL